MKPELPDEKIQWVELEAVFSKAVTRIHWQQLQDQTLWRREWEKADKFV